MSTAMPVTAPTGSRLISEDHRVLPFLGGDLAVDAKGGLARVVLTQRFRNPTERPLRVTLQVPLPADAAVSGFVFTVAGERIEGRVTGRDQAREQFEQALLQGRSAALLEEERSSLFTQEVGNVPAGAEVTCELLLDQPLAWHGTGWTWRFPTVVAPRFLGAGGRVPDADRVAVDVADAPTSPRVDLRLNVRDVRTGTLTSPSHALSVHGGEAVLAEEAGVGLDRDVVVRWPVAGPGLGATLDLARGRDGATAEHASGLLTLVPPAQPPQALPRDLIVLLDTSGSMHGAPLRQAQAVTNALIATLGPQDQLQIVEFSNAVRAWKDHPSAMTPAARQAATTWVSGLRAGGGTQMRDGVLAALERLRGEAVRQVVLVTDGLIGFEAEIVGAIAGSLPQGCRVHTVGVGSAVNRSLLQPAARAGAGLEVILGLDEDPTEAAAAVVAATAYPLVVDVQVSGNALVDVSPTRVPDLMAGRPTRLALRLDAAGGELIVTGRTATAAWEQRLIVPPVAPGSGSAALVTLQARERVQDLEIRAALGHDVDDDIEQLGVAWQISTRLTSWLAVSAATTVDPGDPTRRVQVAQHLPYGMSAEGLGLRPDLASPRMMASQAFMPAAPTLSISALPATPERKSMRSGGRSRKKSASPIEAISELARGLFGSGRKEQEIEEMPASWSDGPDQDGLDDDDDGVWPVSVPAPPVSPQRDVHRARLNRFGDRVTVEIYVKDVGIRWYRPDVVRVVYDDGEVIEVETHLSSCTGDGVWETRDDVLRVVFDAPTRQAHILRVEFDQPDDRTLVMET